MAWLWLAALAAVSACVRSQSALVVAGEFRAAGGVGGLQNIALWNTNAWSRLAGQPLGERHVFPQRLRYRFAQRCPSRPPHCSLQAQ